MYVFVVVCLRDKSHYHGEKFVLCVLSLCVVMGVGLYDCVRFMSA